MSTTSLKLSKDAKQPMFVAEKRAAFVSDAVASRAETLESKKGYSATEVHSYIRARARGETASEPKASLFLRRGQFGVA